MACLCIAYAPRLKQDWDRHDIALKQEPIIVETDRRGFNMLAQCFNRNFRKVMTLSLIVATAMGLAVISVAVALGLQRAGADP